jgi:hypothetical protein
MNTQLSPTEVTPRSPLLEEEAPFPTQICALAMNKNLVMGPETKNDCAGETGLDLGLVPSSFVSIFLFFGATAFVSITGTNFNFLI